MPDLAFPPMGRLGLTSPSSSVLCSATTAICPSRCPSLSLGHRYLVCPFRSCPLSKLVYAQRLLHKRLACLVSRYATSGLLSRKQAALPSSQDNPLNSCPALRPRWCPAHSPYRAQDCCLPLISQRRLSRQNRRLLSTIIQISGLNYTACFLAPAGFGLPLPG